MKPQNHTIARILLIAFALFLSIFAADSFEGGFHFPQTLIALFMHLIPTFFLLLVAFISKKSTIISGIICITLGLAYIGFFHGRFHWSAYLIISGPLFLIAALFIFTPEKKKSEVS